MVLIVLPPIVSIITIDLLWLSWCHREPQRNMSLEKEALLVFARGPYVFGQRLKGDRVLGTENGGPGTEVVATARRGSYVPGDRKDQDVHPDQG